MSQFLELVHARPVIYDGSMGATILNLGLSPDNYGGQDSKQPRVESEQLVQYLSKGARQRFNRVVKLVV